MSGEGYKFVQDATNELHKKLNDLEKRAMCLGEQYDHLLDRASKLEQRTNEYMFRIEKDRKMSVIVELLMRRDKRSELLTDYVWVFFEVVLRKVQTFGVQIDTLKELWLGLQEKATEKVFTAITGKLGFSKAERDAVLLLFEVVHDRPLAECGASKSLTETIVRRRQNEENDEDNSWMRDADVASLILYLQIQDELQTSVRGALRRVVAVAHCGLMGADDTETCLNLGSVPSPELASRFLTSTPKITPKIRRSSSAVPFTTELLDTPTSLRPVHSTQNANTTHLTDRIDSVSLTSGSTPSLKQDVSEPPGAKQCRGSDPSTPMSDTCETPRAHHNDSRVSVPDMEGKSELKPSDDRLESNTDTAKLKRDTDWDASVSVAQDIYEDQKGNKSDNRHGRGTYDTSTDGCQKCVRFSPETVISECDCNDVPEPDIYD